MPDLAIVYEHPTWFEPLFQALSRRGVSWTKVGIQSHVFDPAGSPPPAPVVLSRLAMSSFLRDPEHAIFYAQALFEHWEASGARVLNGSRLLAVDASKARQLSLIHRLGFTTPVTRVVHRAADLVGAAEGLRFPVLVKANIGGSGAGIVRYDTPQELRAAAASRATPVGIDGVSLVQEYAPRRGGKITRIETLNGHFLYAVDVESSGDSFDLCLADVCRAPEPQAPGDFEVCLAAPRPTVKVTRADPPAEAVAAAESVARAAGMDVGGVEVLIDDRDGRVLVYDVNGLSNFVADPVTVLGFDPHDNLIDFLVEQIETRRKAA